ncbi:hypothetical protein MGYG_09145 [Nannizzia gypsea CBS 118893]|uniref:Uncharacterized protein n=1 Tax=Arthroderma gypseum (strain ATCC MYA-4604 / CBS 118893) TaxID=535722 RepID=E4V2J7_ARTGP|nr:hypothetical protein MGYG_09145 [Nannizzia gypsea CBS 118893]EFR04262.1 hypothetical protein MGYG_09145 [Nannizzia gypsea CBS 118893]
MSASPVVVVVASATRIGIINVTTGRPEPLAVDMESATVSVVLAKVDVATLRPRS